MWTPTTPGTNYPAIRHELLAVSQTEFHAEAEKLERKGSWDVLHFFERGRKNEQNSALCPVTVDVIEQHATVTTLAGLAYASKMASGTHVAAHCGPTNLRLRCHMGIQVPVGDCALRVGSEVRGWEQGKCIVFDDSLEHEAWNHTDGTRLVLIVDVWHPDLFAGEIALLEGLHRYSEIMADSLARYWLANDRARIRQRVKSYLNENATDS